MNLTGRTARPSRVPTPAEIAAACKEIQSTWSEAERRTREPGYDWRANVDGSNCWTPPIVRCQPAGKQITGRSFA